MGAPKKKIVEMPVSQWVSILGGWIARKRELWVTLGNMETRFIADKIEGVPIMSPIYICGLPRAGSTLLLEILASHKATVSHCYKDFPILYTPYWWNRYLDMAPKREEIPIERAHKDRLKVTSESPEGMEEILWMTFFPHCHDPELSHVLNEFCENSQFEAFYREHIKKMLVVRGGLRYLAKGNYNITRIEYIFSLFPDARFIIPMRDPCAQVGSLIKQHELFCRAEEHNPQALEHMRQLGHFEFGLDRRPVNTGDMTQIRQTLQSWREKRDVEGYAIQWNAVYGFLAGVLERNSALREATLIVRYEDLVNNSQMVLEDLFNHVGLFDAEMTIQKYAAQISPPNYYKPKLTEDAETIIHRKTDAVAGRFGYPCQS